MPEKIQKAWLDLSLDQNLVSSLNALAISNPTRVQSEAIPKILKSRGDILIADQTGSGKTLAFLLPVLQSLKNDELQSGTQTRPFRPRAIILVPNRELGEQTYSIAKELSFDYKLKVRFFPGGESLYKSDQKELENGVDIMVISPGRLLQFMEKQWVFLKWVQHLVIDEADVLFEKDFKENLDKILVPIQSRITNEKKAQDEKHRAEKRELTRLRVSLEALQATENPNPDEIQSLQTTIHEKESNVTPMWTYAKKSTQIIFAAATFSFSLQKILNTEFPHHRKVTLSTLHKASEKASHQWIPVNLDKHEKLQQIFVQHPNLKTMIFCNTLASCRSTGHFLSSIGVPASNFHGGVPPRQRIDEFEAFKSGETKVIVCTDVASRGIDIPIDHVILFDFPTTISDFVHRSGRTARAGTSGKITSLVQKRDRPLADRIQSCIEQGLALEEQPEEEQPQEETPKRPFKLDSTAPKATPASRIKETSKPRESSRYARERQTMSRSGSFKRFSEDRTSRKEPKTNRRESEEDGSNRYGHKKFVGDRTSNDTRTTTQRTNRRESEEDGSNSYTSKKKFGGDRPEKEEGRITRGRRLEEEGNRYGAKKFGGDRPDKEGRTGSQDGGNRYGAKKFGNGEKNQRENTNKNNKRY